MFQLISPPMPHYITSGEDTYRVGGKHPGRTNIGVFDLLIVTKGCLYLEEESTPYTIPKNNYAILRPDRSHRTATACREETHFYWLHFQTLGSWNEVDEQSSLTFPRTQNPYEQIEYFAFYLPRTGSLQTPENTYTQMRQLLLLKRDPSLLSQWKQQQGFHNLLLSLQEEGAFAGNNPYLRIAEDAAAFLRLNYQEPIKYKELAEALHFHINYIALCMKKTFGCTPLEYVTSYRLEQAKLLLIHTDEAISKIAEETGFGSFPYFIRCFTKHTGTKPKLFRMQYRTK